MQYLFLNILMQPFSASVALVWEPEAQVGSIVVPRF